MLCVNDIDIIVILIYAIDIRAPESPCYSFSPYICTSDVYNKTKGCFEYTVCCIRAELSYVKFNDIS